MSLDDLEEEIKRETAKRISETSSAADAEVERMLGEARSEAKLFVDAAGALAHERADRMYSEFESEVYIECKDALLQAIDDNVRRNIAMLKRELLKSLKGAHYDAFLSKIAKKAERTFADYKPSDVIVEGDSTSIQKFAKRGYTLKKTKIPGIVFRSKDGKIVLAATLDGAIEGNIELVRNAAALAMRSKAEGMKDAEHILSIASGNQAHKEGRPPAAKRAKRQPAKRRGKRIRRG